MVAYESAEASAHSTISKFMLGEVSDLIREPIPDLSAITSNSSSKIRIPSFLDESRLFKSYGTRDEISKGLHEIAKACYT